MAEPVVAVVIPTYSRRVRVERLVSALDAQDLDGAFEVIIVDDASTDDTPEALERLAADRPHLRWHRVAANGGPARARNVGWRLSTAPLIAFTDDDCVPTPGWLRSLVSAAAAADVVQGAIEPDPDQLSHAGPFSRTLRADEARYFQTANVLYPRDLLETLGGFDERFPKACGEDTELAYRAMALGRRTAFAPDALVRHDVSPSDLGAHVRDIARWVDVPLVIALHPEARELLHRRWWWRPSHPVALAAGAGVGLAVAGILGRQPVVAVAGVALGVPYVRYRRRAPVGRGRLERYGLLPIVLFEDLLEIVTMLRGSVRHRTLVL